MVLPWAFILVMASPMGVNATPGPTNPNIHSDYNKLPALEKAKITWDGIPSYEFIENFFDPLRIPPTKLKSVEFTLHSECITSELG